MPIFRSWRLALALPLVLLLLVVAPQRAAAHPLGNFTINVYSRIEVGAAQVDVHYVVDMAEIPTFQQWGRDPHAPAATDARLHTLVAELRRGLTLITDGVSRELQPVEQSLAFPSGQGGLATTRVEVRFTAALPKLTGRAERTVEFVDVNYADRIGWREIVAQTTSGTRIVRSDVPSSDQSNELRAYPDDMLRSPPNRRAARLTITPGASAPRVQQTTIDTTRAQDRFTALVTSAQLGPRGLALTLLIALGLGAAHALSPGHGKTIVAAYLVGTRGTARHALFLGLTVTVTHTLGVFALGLVTLYASHVILPEQLYPWLSVIAGLLVVGMGVALLRQRVRGLWPGRTDHDHTHPHVHGHAHAHAHPEQHRGHAHDDAHPVALRHSHGAHEHDHGAHTHSHLPPGAGSTSVTWRSLLVLGISGGLLPCPSALVVMLSAISLGRVGFGLLLIVAFSVGLAGVLTGVGLLFVHGGAWFGRLSRQGVALRLGAVARVLPVLSALVVTTAGLVVTLQALLQAGLLR